VQVKRRAPGRTNLATRRVDGAATPAQEAIMRNARIPRSPARFVVPFAILGCFAGAFSLYAWGGMGPAEEQIVALASRMQFGIYVVPFEVPVAARGDAVDGAAGHG
jgi:hypothetical protein